MTDPVDISNISVVGLGKLGLPLSAAFASRGFHVMGVDVNLDIVQAVTEGRVRSVEPGLGKLLAEAGSNLAATADHTAAVLATEATIIILPTPSCPDGTLSDRSILKACRMVGPALELKPYHLIIISSTVMPGTCGGSIRRALESSSGRKLGSDFGLCYAPEMIALGRAIQDYLKPDFVLIGSSDDQAARRAENLYRRFCVNHPPLVHTSLVNAEIAKIALNNYLVLKVTFANELAALCEKIPGANVDVVTSTIGLDRRIGQSYLRGATPYGGFCFPRDGAAMRAFASRLGMQFRLAEAADYLNAACFERLAGRVLQEAGAGTVCILGTAYKTNVDATEESFGAKLSFRLAGAGLRVIAHDRFAGSANGEAKNLQASVDAADVVVVALPEPEFTEVRFRAGQSVVDCWRILDRAKVEGAGARYIAVGVGPEGTVP
jgi:UDPglucose 6-dehydrogenase